MINKNAVELLEQVIKNNQKELFMYPYMSLNEYKIVKDFTLDLVKDCTTEKEKAKYPSNNSAPFQLCQQRKRPALKNSKKCCKNTTAK